MSDLFIKSLDGFSSSLQRRRFFHYLFHNTQASQIFGQYRVSFRNEDFLTLVLHFKISRDARQ